MNNEFFHYHPCRSRICTFRIHPIRSQRTSLRRCSICCRCCWPLNRSWWYSRASKHLDLTNRREGNRLLWGIHKTATQVWEAEFFVGGVIARKFYAKKKSCQLVPFGSGISGLADAVLENLLEKLQHVTSCLCITDFPSKTSVTWAQAFRSPNERNHTMTTPAAHSKLPWPMHLSVSREVSSHVMIKSSVTKSSLI